MKRVGNWFASSWHPLALFLGCVTLLLMLLWLQLGTLVPGFSQNELNQRAASGTVRAIVDNPLGAPHKVLQLGAHYTKHIGPAAMRSASAIIGVAVACSLYYVLKGWYSRRVAVFGVLMFITSAWFLHSARLGTDSILFALLITALAAAVWLQRSRGRLLALIGGAIVIIGLLYIPGMIWFIVPAFLWQSQRIGRLLEYIPFGVVVALILIGMVLLGPLGWAIYQEPHLAKTFFGLPQTFPAPMDLMKNIAHVPIEIFFRGPQNPELWLGRLPLLDWFAVGMFAIGIYAHTSKLKLDRTWLFLYIFVVGSVLAGLKGPVSSTILLPFVYIVIAGGVGLMLQQWFTVFPRNPVARGVGMALVILAVGVSCLYNVTHYFVAWPDAPATRQTFIHRP